MKLSTPNNIQPHDSKHKVTQPSSKVFREAFFVESRTFRARFWLAGSKTLRHDSLSAEAGEPCVEKRSEDQNERLTHLAHSHFCQSRQCALGKRIASLRHQPFGREFSDDLLIVHA